MLDLVLDEFGLSDTSFKLPTEYSFYDGTELIYFDHAAHVYTRLVDDEIVVVPGATTVTDFMDKPQLVPWAAKMCCIYLRENYDFSKQYSAEEFKELLLKAKRHFRDYTEKAAETGSIAHDWVEKYIKAKISNAWFNSTLPSDPRAANAILAFLKWESEHHVLWLASERKVYSRTFRYAGTMDCLAVVDGVLAVIDIKTSNHHHRLQHGMQVAAYQAAQMEELGLEIKARWIIRLGKEDAEFDPMFLPEETFQHDFTCFLSLLDAYNNVQFHEQLEREGRNEARAELKAEKEAAKLAEKQSKAFAKEQKKREKEAAKLLKVKAPRRRKAA